MTWILSTIRSKVFVFGRSKPDVSNTTGGQKSKNAQSAGNWDHDPCKAIQTNKTSEHAACINEAKTTTHLDCACATKSPKHISVEAETC
jgi:hypothetical protein